MWQVVEAAQLCVYLYKKVRREEKRKRSSKKIMEREMSHIPDIVRTLLELRSRRTTSVTARGASRSSRRSGSRGGGGGGSRSRSGGRGRGRRGGRTSGGTGSHTKNVVPVLAAHVRTGAGLSRLLKDKTLIKEKKKQKKEIKVVHTCHTPWSHV